MRPRTLLRLVALATVATLSTACLDSLGDLGATISGLFGDDEAVDAAADDGDGADDAGEAAGVADMEDDLPDQETIDALEELLDPVDEADDTEDLVAQVLAGDVYVAPLHAVDIPAPGTAVVEVSGNAYTIEGIECTVELGGEDQRVSFDTVDGELWLDVWRYTTDGSTYLTEGVRLTTGYDPDAGETDSLGLVQVELFAGNMDYSMGGGDLPIVRYDDGAITAAGRMFGILGENAGGEFTLGANCG